MRAKVLAIDAVLADGARVHLGEVAPDLSDVGAAERPLAEKLLAIGAREAGEVELRFPKVHRRVGGYNLDALGPRNNRINLAHVLVGSEGTLAYSTAITLQLSPVLGKRALGVCHFGSFHAAMLKGKPRAILLVEFDSGEEENARRMTRLLQMMGDLGFDFSHEGANWGGVVEVYDPALQNAITELRKSGLNIMMSMKDQAKPISFVEDCAVPLEHLAEYTARLTDCFERHGTRGTWYAHASEGCLHVRPVLNLRLEKDVKAMRAIAEEAFAMVRQYKGSHSGEHGDGLVRSEFHREMFGPRLVKAFEEVKDVFDPKGMMNPGKIVRAPRFDERDLFRYAPDYKVRDFQPALDWSEYPGAIAGFQGAAEQCNNNGACR
jgi:FAD/FMN-containing dehydrogenase